MFIGEEEGWKKAERALGVESLFQAALLWARVTKRCEEGGQVEGRRCRLIVGGRRRLGVAPLHAAAFWLPGPHAHESIKL